MMRFSEFYGPERQRELLSEAKNQRLIRAATANQQPWLMALKENKMYRKIAIALIVIGSLTIGYIVFTISTAQASHDCIYDSTILGANPELTVACGDGIGYETGVPRAIVEASPARYAGLVEYYAAASATGSTYFASNPELMAYNRYALEAHSTHAVE